MITQHFKTPQDVIQDYYYQKHLESVAPRKPTMLLMLARGNHKLSLRELYLKEMIRKNYYYYIGRDVDLKFLENRNSKKKSCDRPS